MLKCTREEFEKTLDYAFQEVGETRPRHLPHPETCRLLAQLCYQKGKECPFLREYLDELSERGAVYFLPDTPKDATRIILRAVRTESNTFDEMTLSWLKEVSRDPEIIMTAIRNLQRAARDLEDRLEWAGITAKIFREAEEPPPEVAAFIQLVEIAIQERDPDILSLTAAEGILPWLKGL